MKILKGFKSFPGGAQRPARHYGPAQWASTTHLAGPVSCLSQSPARRMGTGLKLAGPRPI
jgi:hypothetical protein